MISTKDSDDFQTTKSIRNTFGFVNHITSMSTTGYEADENKMLTGSSDGKIRIADLNSNAKIVNTIDNQGCSIRHMKMQDSTGYLLVADMSNTVKLWDLRSCSLISSYKDKGGHKTCIDTYKSDSFITSSEDGLLSIWDYRVNADPLAFTTVVDRLSNEKTPCKINKILHTRDVIYAACDSGMNIIRGFDDISVS